MRGLWRTGGLWRTVALLCFFAPALVHSVDPPGIIDAASIAFSAVSDASATASWAAPDTGSYELPIEGYRVRLFRNATLPVAAAAANGAACPAGAQCTPPAGGAAGWEEVQGVRPKALTVALVGLKPNSLYYVSVRAYNTYGHASWSASSYGLHTHAVPERVPKPAVVTSGSAAFSLSWSAPPTRGTLPCANASLRDVKGGVCTTGGTGSALTGYSVTVEWSGYATAAGLYDATVPAVSENFTAGVNTGDAKTTLRVVVKRKTASHGFFGKGSDMGFVVGGVEGGSVLLTAGTAYAFELDASVAQAPGHPIYLSSKNDGGDQRLDGALDASHGVKGAQVTGGVVSFTPTASQVGTTLYYWCAKHPWMGGQITVKAAAVTDVKEVQTVTVGAGADDLGGTFKLGFSGQVTSALAKDLSDADAMTVLNALSTVSGAVVARGAKTGNGHVYTVTFATGTGDVALITCDKTSLTGTSATCVVAQATKGQVATSPASTAVVSAAATAAAQDGCLSVKAADCSLKLDQQKEFGRTQLRFTLPITQTTLSIGALRPNSNYHVAVAALNKVGSSSSSEVAIATTEGTPLQMTPPVSSAVTNTSISVQWAAPEAPAKSPITGYRLWVTRWDADALGYVLSVFGNTMASIKSLGGPLPDTTPYVNLTSWVEVPANGTETVLTLSHLMPAQKYVFKILAYNAAGDGYASMTSSEYTTLDTPLTWIKLFAGSPCIYGNPKTGEPTTRRTKFIAITDGTNPTYRWTSKDGQMIASEKSFTCLNKGCYAMEYSFPNAGVDTVVNVVASNSRGSMAASLVVFVELCGCTDPYDTNYWYLATYHVPSECAKVAQWGNSDMILVKGAVKSYELEYAETTHAAEVTLRVDTGRVSIYAGVEALPDASMNHTYVKNSMVPMYKVNVTDFAKLWMNYIFLHDSKRVWITVVGEDSFSRFGLVGRSSDFTQGPFAGVGADGSGAPVRNSLGTTAITAEQKTDYYDFYEHFFKATQGLKSVVTVKLTVEIGCAQLYVSKTERYPSPRRAFGADTTKNVCRNYTAIVGYGHEVHSNVKVCAGDDAATATVTYMASETPVLYISVLAAEPYKQGARPPHNKYTISATSESVSVLPFVADNATVSELRDGSTLEATIPGMDWKFYRIRPSNYAAGFEVKLSLTAGKASVYKSAGHLPTKGWYDEAAHDDNGDGTIVYTLPWTSVCADRQFYIGVFSDSKYSTQGEKTTTKFNITLTEKQYTCSAPNHVVSASSTTCTHPSVGHTILTGLMDGKKLAQTISPGGFEPTFSRNMAYRYYALDMTPAPVGSNSTSNVTASEFSAVPPGLSEYSAGNLFAWTTPWMLSFLEDTYAYRLVNVKVKLLMFAAKEASKSQGDSDAAAEKRIAASPVDITVFGSMSDPFPGYHRTYDVVATKLCYTISCAVELTIPRFTFNGAVAHIAVASSSPNTTSYTLSATMTEAGEASAAAAVSRRMCPGQAADKYGVTIGLPCSGRGSCVDVRALLSESDDPEGTPTGASPVCYCNQGFAGNDCSVSRKLASGEGYVKIIYPQSDDSVTSDMLNVSYAVTPAIPGLATLVYVDGKFRGEHPVVILPEKSTDAASNETASSVVTAKLMLQSKIAPGKKQTMLEIVLIDAVSRKALSRDSTLVNSPTSICPSDCSGNGICHMGYCVCFDNFAGVGCELSDVNATLKDAGRSKWGYQVASDIAASSAEGASAADLDLAASYTRLRADGERRGDRQRQMRQRLADLTNEHARDLQAFKTAILEAALAEQAKGSASSSMSASQKLAYQAKIDAAKDVQTRLAEDPQAVVQARMAEFLARVAKDKAVYTAEIRESQERASFDLRRTQGANGPRTKIDDLRNGVCTRDATGKVTCVEEKLASDKFESGKGYRSTPNTLNSKTGKIELVAQDVVGEYDDVPR